MSAIQQFESYLTALGRRLRLQVYTRAAAYISAAVLLSVVLSVAWLTRLGFDPAAVITSRWLIGLTLVVLVGLLVWRPLRNLGLGEGAQEYERRLPDEQGRITTFIDARRNTTQASPLVELLAQDAVRVASTHSIDSIVPPWRVIAHAIAAVLVVLALIGLLNVAPDQWRLGARHVLLAEQLPREVLPIRRIVVTPGDATVRRNSDLLVRASLDGFDPDRATLHVRFADQTQWERAPMQPVSAAAPAFELKLFALRSPLTYYVEADGARSATHKVVLADLPRIEEMRLTYRYPDWTGLPSLTDVDSRDIRAVAGTEVAIEIRSNGTLHSPVLVHDGQEVPLSSSQDKNAGTLQVNRPGRYHVAARVAGDTVALSDEYTIEIIPDEKPTISIEKPGRDWRATSIEEVPVHVRATDDFRLQNVELRYAVNGGEWRSMALDRNVKQTRERTLLELEKLGAEASKDGATLLAPGDLVSYYAVAKDHKRAVQTDLFMVQVQPFERRFLQQNAGGGGGGMGDEQGAISERQREILLATWNLQRSDDNQRRGRAQLEDNARMLAEMQTTLAQQARTLAARTRARTQIEEDERIKTFVESLEAAALAMEPAALHLSAFELDKAVAPEQQALQQLLRAEAAFRDVQVSMQGESGGQGSQSARDFSEMFELEMDVQKSQYESEQQVAQEGAQQEQDEAARKLKELAQRQEQLAQEAKRNQTLTPEQRWRQEQLRREAEDLRRQLAEMQQRSASSQQAQRSNSGGSGASSSEGESSSEPQRDASQRAIDSMDRALEEMQAANREGNPQAESSGSAQQASDALRRASEQLQSDPTDGLSAQLDNFAERASQLQREQHEIESELLRALSEAGQNGPRSSQPGQIDEQQAQSLVESKQAMAEALSELQKDLRNTAHAHRGASNPAKQQLTEIVNDVEASDLMYRVRRSAAEIYYGRARDAAAREGIITESIEALEQNLRDAAALAREGQSRPGERPTSESVLAEVADLRRRLEQRERLAAANAQAQESDDASSSASQSEAESSGAQGAQQSAEGSTARSADRGSGNRALSAWDPNLVNARLPNAEQASRDSLARQANTLAERANRISQRASSRELSASELSSLQQLAREVRQLAGDPMASRSAALRRAVAQLELAALAARTSSMRSETARTTVPIAEAQEYREAVAEYYRRLGGS